MHIVLVSALALLVGLTLALLGGGGTILAVPILRHIVGLEPAVAVAASLFIVGTTSALSVAANARKGTIRWDIGLLFGSASAIGAVGGSAIAPRLDPDALMTLFSIMMVVTGIAMIRKKSVASNGSNAAKTISKKLPYHWIVVEGAVVGFITGMVGAGGGFLVVPALMLLGGLPLPVAVSTSLLVIAIKSAAGFVSISQSIAIPWGITLGFAALTVIGSLLGSFILSSVDTNKLGRGFGLFVVLLGSGMLIDLALSFDFGAIGLPLENAGMIVAGLVVFFVGYLFGRLRSNPALPESHPPQWDENPAV